MAFDAGMFSFILYETETKLMGGKIEKIYMPQKDMVVLSLKNGGNSYRLLINAGPSSPRVCITADKYENPSVPPMFCMMLRKHIHGAKLIGVEQFGFERAARFVFETYDELGFKTTKSLIAEIMGKYSNLILVNDADKVLGLLKPVDFTTSRKRQLLPGILYEKPPVQEKTEPIQITDAESFFRLLSIYPDSMAADKALLAAFCGISALNAREIVFETTGSTDTPLAQCMKPLYQSFQAYVEAVREHKGQPTLLCLPDGTPKEYSYVPIHQYGNTMQITQLDSYSALIDRYFAERNKKDALHQRASDIFRVLNAAEARIQRKLSIQLQELQDCDAGDTYKLYAELLTANLYCLKRGMKKAVVENYYTGETVEIPLDGTLSPSQNAQRYYKKYTKTKNARVHLTQQVENDRLELAYIQSVSDALTRAETENDCIEIREELYHSGYASKMKTYTAKKRTTPSVLHFVTSDGRAVICGKNNISNEYVTTKLAERSDWWFHVKNQPGSHVVMQSSGEQDEPTERDFTEAAMIAAWYSKVSGGVMVPVDYTHVHAVKKPAGSKPGFVVYKTNWTAYVTPDPQLVEKLARK